MQNLWLETVPILNCWTPRSIQWGQLKHFNVETADCTHIKRKYVKRKQENEKQNDKKKKNEQQKKKMMMMAMMMIVMMMKEKEELEKVAAE